MVYSITEIQKIALPIIKKYNIPAAYLFGSYARGDATENSDLDFLVDTTGTQLTSLLRLGELYCDLQNAFNKPIDLITMRSVLQEGTTESDKNFTETVMRERVKLYDVA